MPRRPTCVPCGPPNAVADTAPCPPQECWDGDHCQEFWKFRNGTLLKAVDLDTDPQYCTYLWSHWRPALEDHIDFFPRELKCVFFRGLLEGLLPAISSTALKGAPAAGVLVEAALRGCTWCASVKPYLVVAKHPPRKGGSADRAIEKLTLLNALKTGDDFSVFDTSADDTLLFAIYKDAYVPTGSSSPPWTELLYAPVLRATLEAELALALGPGGGPASAILDEFPAPGVCLSC